ncbi:MAG TPA: hypothetical protein VNV62_24140 [Trebonia sp.]|nr:hypothetical protein [Trebonia sp.]
MRVKTLIASSSALIAAVIFAVASGLPGLRVDRHLGPSERSDVVANVLFQRAKTGGLAWGFFLTKVAREKLGAVVTVTMPVATINNKAINPPYSPHTRSSGYNFHSSLKFYNFVGSKTRHEIKTGDKLLLYWVIVGEKHEGAYRYVRCTIPKPGAH